MILEKILEIPEDFLELKTVYGRYNEVVAVDGDKEIDTVMANSEQFSPLSLKAYVEYIRKIVSGQAERAFIALNLYPTLDCNNRCVHCYAVKSSPSGIKYLGLDKINSLLVDLAREGVLNPRVLGGGEATLHQNIGKILKDLNTVGFATTLITNGTDIKDLTGMIVDNVKLIRISLDGADEMSRYYMHRVKDFKGVIKSLKDLKQKTDARNDPYQHLGITYIIKKENMHLVFQSAEIARDLGLDSISYRIHKEMTPTYFNESEREDISAQLRKAETQFKRDIAILRRFYINDISPFIYKPPEDGVCLTKKLRFLINSDGSVQTCNSYNFEEAWNYGNINRQSFAEIVNSDKVFKIINRKHNVPCPSVCCLKHANEVFYFIAKNLRQNSKIKFITRYNPTRG